MEISENKDDKEDNSYAKGVEEEKGDTLMKFKTGKISDNNKEAVYNNIDQIILKIKIIIKNPI